MKRARDPRGPRRSLPAARRPRNPPQAGSRGPGRPSYQRGLGSCSGLPAASRARSPPGAQISAWARPGRQPPRLTCGPPGPRRGRRTLRGPHSEVSASSVVLQLLKKRGPSGAPVRAGPVRSGIRDTPRPAPNWSLPASAPPPDWSAPAFCLRTAAPGDWSGRAGSRCLLRERNGRLRDTEWTPRPLRRCFYIGRKEHHSCDCPRSFHE